MTSHTLGNISPTFWYEQGGNVFPFSLQQPSHNSRQIHDVLVARKYRKHFKVSYRSLCQ